MSARPGNWQLLEHDTDPVGGDPEELHVLVGYYTKMADTISSEATMLEQIGSGDGTSLQGKSADALRARSRSVAGSLKQTSGRYNAVRDALAGYAPSLDRARDESFRALQDAVAADGAQSAGKGMADPSTNRPVDAPPLTPEENAQIHARTDAISDAEGALARARSRLAGAVSELTTAGQAAAGVISDAWNDGLVDTLAYKIKQAFIKFLKILVKVLMWIGVALAVLAFFVPGLGALALAGAAVAVLALAASTALAAMGEGSWLNVILAAVTVFMLGAGVLLAKLIQTTHLALLGKVASAGVKPHAATAAKVAQMPKVAKAVSSIAKKRAAVFAQALKGDIPVGNAMKRIGSMDKELKKVSAKSLANATGKVAADFKVKPQWWNVRHPDYLKNDLGKIADVRKGDWRWDRLLAVDRVRKYQGLRGITQMELGIDSKAVPVWNYANAGRIVGSWTSNTFSLGARPTGINGDTSRSAGYDAALAYLTTPRV